MTDPAGALKADVDAALDWLREKSTEHDRANMTRFAITADKAFGVSMASMKVLAKRLGRNHALAGALWDTGWYEARMLASLIDDPACVTPEQMDRWRRDFDSWAICDTVCFHLFDRTPLAFGKAGEWCVLNDEFGKRAGFALLASLALHRKAEKDEPFLQALALVENAATDDRNFVKKGVNWALRAIGGRRSPALRTAAREVAERLAGSGDATARWVGKDAMRAFAKSRASKAKGTGRE